MGSHPCDCPLCEWRVSGSIFYSMRVLTVVESPPQWLKTHWVQDKTRAGLLPGTAHPLLVRAHHRLHVRAGAPHPADRCNSYNHPPPPVRAGWAHTAGPANARACTTTLTGDCDLPRLRGNCGQTHPPHAHGRSKQPSPFVKPVVWCSEPFRRFHAVGVIRHCDVLPRHREIGGYGVNTSAAGLTAD